MRDRELCPERQPRRIARTENNICQSSKTRQAYEVNFPVVDNNESRRPCRCTKSKWLILKSFSSRNESLRRIGSRGICALRERPSAFTRKCTLYKMGSNNGLGEYLDRMKKNPKLTDQGVTPCWKSVHLMTGYQGYQPNIRGILNGYPE